MWIVCLGNALTDEEALALRLNEHFPLDVGLFSAFLLNHLTLKPLSAIFLPAGLPHAYIHGGLLCSAI